MKNRVRAIILVVFSTCSVIFGIGIGSVFIHPSDTLRICSDFLFGTADASNIDTLYYGLVTSIRLPRVLMAFLAGAAIAVSGTVMQSVLKNPLASSYGLGVSSGAGLGAVIMMVYGAGLGSSLNYVLPMVATLFGFGAVLLALMFVEYVDKSLSSNTIILAGMVVSLFLNAIMNMLATYNAEFTHRILLWQLGTFAGREWTAIGVLAVVFVVCLIFFQRHSKEMDVLTFGEEQAMSIGVETKKEKWLLIGVTSLLTSTAVSFVGIIGFVDLIAPHVVRKFFGASHKWVIPMSALFGGMFMVLCDLAGRTITSPREIPVGSITALLGAPFFLYIYFVSRRSKS